MGLFSKKLRFRAPDKSIVEDAVHIEDFTNGEEIGRVCLGKLCFYYRDLGKRYIVPYEYIERSFCRISETHPDDSPAYYYYRLILVHEEKEFANLIFNKEEDVDLIIEKLQKINPAMAVGYIPPPESGKKHFFHFTRSS